MTRKLGCKKDSFDERDRLMRAYLPPVKLPARVDYSRLLSPVRDQGDEGTCVGFATVSGMKEYQEKVDYEKLVLLSPRFLYYECKQADGLPSSEGTTIRTAMKVLGEKGVCRESFLPYSPRQKDKPSKSAYADGKKFGISSYARIIDLAELKMSLFSKGPCVIGVEVFRGMMDAKKGVVPVPSSYDSPLGGHALCPVGYDDRKRLVKFKNSWSENWGDNGFGYLPYAYIEKYMMDAWSSVDIEDPNPLTLASVREYWKRA